MQEPGTYADYLYATTPGDLIHRDASVQRMLSLDLATKSLATVSLHDLDHVTLMNRIDLKYLVGEDSVPGIINSLSKEYSILEIDGCRMADYETVYLDTMDLTFFLTHVNGKLNRFKWRIRKYVDSGMTFLEIKNKSNKGRTDKKRILMSPSKDLNDSNISEFITQNSDLGGNSLLPVLQNKFNRMTFINAGKTERLTIDLNISFHNYLSGKSLMVPKLAIIELKQDRTLNSAASALFSHMRIKKSGLSTYCLGMVLSAGQVKGNLYKQKIRQITKILYQQ